MSARSCYMSVAYEPARSAGSEPLHVTCCVRKKSARAREGGDSVGAGGRTAPLRDRAGFGGGPFPLFADARPLSPSQPFSQSTC